MLEAMLLMAFMDQEVDQPELAVIDRFGEVPLTPLDEAVATTLRWHRKAAS